MFDRARFPRHKLCGDTLNPGALARAARGTSTSRTLLAQSDPIDGMLLTGPGGVRCAADTARRDRAASITREVLDHWLIERAVEAGARAASEEAA